MSTITTLPGQQTLLESWRALARTSPGARRVDTTNAAGAVFPAWTELNNAILRSDDYGAALTELRGIYAAAGVERWALWAPSATTDLDAADRRTLPGLERDTTTLVMGLVLPDGLARHAGVLRTSIATATRATDEPIPGDELDPPDAVPGLTGWVLIQAGRAVAGAWSYRYGSDCGIYTVGTAPAWQRRGHARRLVEHVLADARSRGARTATVQSTGAGQRLYESLGFRPVGRYEEWLVTAGGR
jgi:ribosomal protein S18 acetylase RimI-like enzyme